MKLILALLPLLILSSPAIARDWVEYLCKFTQQCVGEDACEAIEGEMSLLEDLTTGHARTDLDGAFFAVVTDQPDADALGYDVSYTNDADMRGWYGQKDGRFQMLSVFADGTARQTTHYAHTIFTQTGTCKKVE